MSRLLRAQEITGYLNRIYHTWSALFEGTAELVDWQSVRRVENLVPDMSSTDRDAVIDMMDNGTLFPSVQGSGSRNALLGRLLNTSGRILSLHSLVQDTLLWHPCAQALRQLVPRRFKDLRQALLLQFQGTSGEWVIQVAENDFESIRPGSGDVSGPGIAAYVQLWLFTVRYVESLTHTNLPASKNERDSEGYSLRLTRRESTHKLAILAKQLGFKSREIDALCEDSALKPNARAYLFGRRPPNHYVYRQHWDNKAAEKIVQLLEVPKPKSKCEVMTPHMTTDNPEKVKRCGLPSIRPHLTDRELIYIPHIYCPGQPGGRNPTSFAILRDMVFAFFGREIFLDGICPWWSRNRQISVEETRQETQEEEMSDPVDLEPHPPGTPDRNSTVMTEADQAMGIVAPVPQTIIATMAPGFEDRNHIAPLNQVTYISHHRSFDEMIREWSQHIPTSPAVIYFFKDRKYCKFDRSSPDFAQEVTYFVNSVANTHFFIGAGGMHPPGDVSHALRMLPLLLACTDIEHYTMEYSPIKYITTFDPKTGKRQTTDEDSPHQPRRKLLGNGKLLENGSSTDAEPEL
ncbi:hypothetical protein BJX63DRAFT_438539 [Aspergillus granulosus]|uniref:Uncharacterized protein n=1 Tax=Aspergillus granulosus TaxID=176169 RepID=A0ABR4GRP3_9EURO